MKLTEIFLADLEREIPASRRVLERVPDGSYDWKPHPKSMQMGYLSTLVATMPSWIDSMVNQDELDFAPKGGSKYKAPELRTGGELVQALEESVAKARAALKGTTDEHLMTTWRLLAGGHVVAEIPRHIQIRDGVLNHWAHHRGQLTVYLRLNDVPVPSVYGPTADEGLGSR
jgi:uncharacterized damage-inducible protein DinB